MFNERHTELWRKLREKFNAHDGKWPPWSVLAEAAWELGYEDYARAWGFSPPRVQQSRDGRMAATGEPDAR